MKIVNKDKDMKYVFAKLSPSPSEAGLSKLYNHGVTAKPPPQNRHRQTAIASESTLLHFVGSWNSV